MVANIVDEIFGELVIFSMNILELGVLLLFQSIQVGHERGLFVKYDFSAIDEFGKVLDRDYIWNSLKVTLLIEIQLRHFGGMILLTTFLIHEENLVFLALHEDLKTTLFLIVSQTNQSLHWIWDVEVFVASEKIYLFILVFYLFWIPPESDDCNLL